MRTDLRSEEIKISQWAEALPESFPFYHMGNVEVSRQSQVSIEISPEDHVVLGFRLLGDMRGILFVIFDRGLDLSMYTEMGNILASRFATRLSEKEDVDVMISAPAEINEEEFHRSITVSQATRLIHRTYVHDHNQISIPVQMLVLPMPSEGAGNA